MPFSVLLIIMSEWMKGKSGHVYVETARKEEDWLQANQMFTLKSISDRGKHRRSQDDFSRCHEEYTILVHPTPVDRVEQVKEL